MKKIIILAVCLAVLTVVNSSAKIWRVNSAGLPADFTTIQGAHDATTVLAGDTLHIEPSTISYGALTSTKKLIIIGPGYFLNENAGQQANPTTATIGRLLLTPGSEGSIITGLTIIDANSHGIHTGNITVSRNNFAGGYIYLLGNGGSYSDVIISGNYGINKVTFSNSSTSTVTNIFILNNVVTTFDLTSQFSGTIANNVIESSNLKLSNFIIKNNICRDVQWQAVFVGSNNTISNNISAANGGLPAGSGNLNGVSMGTVFVGLSGNSTDGQYQLKVGSPAIGAGLSGEDCGIFGGSTPYHLSGVPATPSIYLLSAPAASNGPTLPVTISVKTNK
jgi:hypothetical protein